MIADLAKLFNELKEKNLENLIKEAAGCKDASEIAALLKNNGIDVTDECASQCFNMYHESVELSDEELDDVAGGKKVEVNGNICPKCGGKTTTIDPRSGKTVEIVRKMDTIGSGYKGCDGGTGRFYWQYKCPVCGEKFRHFINDGYWTD